MQDDEWMDDTTERNQTKERDDTCNTGIEEIGN